MRLAYDIAIFDWNGTLLDDMWLSTVMKDKIFERYGTNGVPSDEDFFGGISNNYMEYYYSRGVPRSIMPRDLNIIRESVYREGIKNLYLHNNAKKVLMALRKIGMKVALVSAEDANVFNLCLDALKVRDLFGFVESDVKDKTKTFENISSIFNIIPRRMFYVGDTVGDLRSAQLAGIDSFGVSTGFNGADKLETQASIGNNDKCVVGNTVVLDSLADVFDEVFKGCLALSK